MGKRSLIVIVITAFIGVFCLAAAAAAQEAPKEPLDLQMENATRPLIIKFSHESHKDNKCNECHHVYTAKDGEYPKDPRGKYKKLPTNEWKEGDEVHKCAECHKYETDQKKRNDMLKSPTEIRSYRTAYHNNCADCHKSVNKKKKLKGKDKLPQSCNNCHEKQKK